MVGSINPSTSGALGIDTRAARPQLTLARRETETTQDSASVSDAQAAWRAAQDSVSDGLAELDLALAAGREALARLNEIGERARTGGDAQPALEAFRAGLASAQSRLLSGQTLEIAAEPGGSRLAVEGIDLNALGLDDAADGAGLARAAQDGAARLQTHLTRLEGVARSLDAHAGFVSTAGAALGVRGDVDADSARLLALQVKQGLEAHGGAIANANPQAVLALFRA